MSITFQTSTGITTSSYLYVYMINTNACIIGFSSGECSYYSTNSGQSWTKSNGITTQQFYYGVFDGANGIAPCLSPSLLKGMYYTSDCGVNWMKSTLVGGGAFNISVQYSYLSGIYGVCFISNKSYYSQNYGQTWTESTTSITGTTIRSSFLIGQSGVVSADTSIQYTSDGGINWNLSNITTLGINSLFMISQVGNVELSGIAGGSNSALGIWYTSNSGRIWTKSTGISAGVNGLFMNNAGKGIAGGNSSYPGIWYTANYGQSWTKNTSFTNRIFQINSMYMVNDIGIAASNNGILITTDAGINWTLSGGTGASGSFNCATMFRLNAIAGGSTAGLRYNTVNLCYGENIEILCLIDEKEVFIKITDLKKDMFVKTYKKGYKKITHYKNFNYLCMDETDNLNCLYKFKNKDIIMTGGHSILVDDLTPEQTNNVYQFKEMIEDKHLLLSCLSDDFEKINDKNNYVLYHFVLENVNREGHYGVYINDYILSESCSEKLFVRLFN